MAEQACPADGKWMMAGTACAITSRDAPRFPVNEHIITTTAGFADFRAQLLPDTPDADPDYLIVDGRPLTLGFLPDPGLSCIIAG